MKWDEEHIAKYMEAKEYIDTLLFPLAPFTLQEAESEKWAKNKEILKLLANEVEKNLVGRIFKVPIYLYLLDARLQDEINRLKTWNHSIENLPFKYRIYITFHNEWRKYEENLDGELIWLPSFHSLDIQTGEFKQIIYEQAKEITDYIQTSWK